MMVIDTSVFRPGVHVYRAPLMTATDQLGVRKCMNIVALGALARLPGFLTVEQLSKAAQLRAPGRAEINRKAVQLGYDAGLKLARARGLA